LLLYIITTSACHRPRRGLAANKDAEISCIDQLEKKPLLENDNYQKYTTDDEQHTQSQPGDDSQQKLATST